MPNKINYNFFVSIIAPLLISGPFFPDLIVSLSSLLFLIYIFKNKLFFYFNKKPYIIFFIFCIYCIFVSIFFAKDLFLSFESSLFYFRIGIFACFIFYLIEQDKKILNYFYYALIFSFSILTIDAYIQFLLGYNIAGLPVHGSRISSFFGDELILGSYLARLFPFLFALFLIRKKNNIEKYYFFFLYGLVFLIIYLSGERTAFFFMCLSQIFILILIKRYQKLIILISIIILIFASVITLNNKKVKDRMIEQVVDVIVKKDNEKGEKFFIFSRAHDSLIRTAFNMFKEKPIFGHGPKMFRVLCEEPKYRTGIEPCLTHPHNFYAQLLAETGIIGFMFLLSAFMYVIYCALRQLKTIFFKEKKYLSDYQVCLLACLLITVWPLSPNGNFFNNWIAIVYSLPVGFYLHSIYGKNRKKILKE